MEFRISGLCILVPDHHEHMMHVIMPATSDDVPHGHASAGGASHEMKHVARFYYPVENDPDRNNLPSGASTTEDESTTYVGVDAANTFNCFGENGQGTEDTLLSLPSEHIVTVTKWAPRLKRELLSSHDPYQVTGSVQLRRGAISKVRVFDSVRWYFPAEPATERHMTPSIVWRISDVGKTVPLKLADGTTRSLTVTEDAPLVLHLIHTVPSQHPFSSPSPTDPNVHRRGDCSPHYPFYTALLPGIPTPRLSRDTKLSEEGEWITIRSSARTDDVNIKGTYPVSCFLIAADVEDPIQQRSEVF